MQEVRGMRDFLSTLWSYSESINGDNFISLLEKNSLAKLLDLRYGNGEFTIDSSKIIGTKTVYDFDVVEERLIKSEKKGIKIIQSDLNKKLPIKDDLFNVIILNKLIEHLDQL